MIDISTGFNISSNQPLDNRCMAVDINMRNSIPVEYRYEGLQCYVKEDQSVYLLSGGIENNNWVDVKSIVPDFLIYDKDTCPRFLGFTNSDANKVASNTFFEGVVTKLIRHVDLTS